jgi:hypothetical protein
MTETTTAEGVVLLDRAAILAADDIKYEDIYVPEWGGTVRARSLTGTERDQYDAESYRAQQGKGEALADFRVRRVAKSLVDADGKRLFSDADLAVLGAKNGAVIDRLDDVVARLAGLAPDAVPEAITTLKGDPSGGSGTA